jgi:PAS domain S-box-containing protein
MGVGGILRTVDELLEPATFTPTKNSRYRHIFFFADLPKIGDNTLIRKCSPSPQPTKQHNHGIDDMANAPDSNGSRFWQRIQGQLLLVLLVVLVPTLLLQAHVFSEWYKSSREAALQANLQIARAVAKTFDRFIQDVLHKEYAIGLALTRSNLEDQRDYFEKNVADYPMFLNLAWLSPDGVILLSTYPEAEGQSRRDRGYFRDIVAGRDWSVSNLMIGQVTRTPCIVVARANRDDQGRLLGIVLATIASDKLGEALAIERPQGGAVSLVDENGMLVFRHPSINPTWEERNWIKDYPRYAEVFAGKEISESYFAPYEGKNRLVANVPVESIGWAAGAGITEDAAMQPVVSQLLPQIVLLLAITLAAFGVALLSSRFLVNPVKRLRNHAIAFGSGHVTAPIAATGPAEIRDLVSAFNTMAEELKSRETDLREQREWLRVTLSGIGDAVIATDVTGTITFINPVAAALTGWESDEAVGRSVENVFRVINEQTRRNAGNIVERVLAEGNIVNMANNTALITRDGREVPIEDSAAPIRDKEGMFLGVVLVFHDVTEKRRAQEALRESRQKNEFLADILKMASQPFGVGYPDGSLGLVNSAFEQLTGYGGDELRSINWANALTPPEWVPVERQKLEELHRTGKPVRYEKEYIRKDGSRVPIELLVHLVTDSDGKPQYYYSFLTDITERKMMDDELRKSHDELELRVRERTAELLRANQLLRDQAALLDLAHDAVFVRGIDETAKFWNNGAVETYGFLKEEALGKTIHELLRTRFPEPLEQIMEHLMRKGRWEGELSHTTSAGKEIVVESRWAEQTDKDGNLVGILEINRDITARKLAEEALKTNMARLELVNAELQEFAFVASHDLQEPLRKIQTFCDMTVNRCAPVLDDTSQDYLRRVMNSASRMRQLLDDLLQFSRVATRSQPFKRIDLARIVREAADVFEERIREEGGSIEIAKLPDIEADETQLLRLFQNLISNAVKFRGDGTPRIEVSGRGVGKGFCEVIVKDNGIGFDPEYRELIFKPFQRLHTRDKYDGTGMGLAICRKIVERHGGNIRAESERGGGAVFIIRLPLKQKGYM